MNGNHRVKPKRMNLSTPISICSPQQHLQEISFFEPQQQSWDPLSSQEIIINGWKIDPFQQSYSHSKILGFQNLTSTHLNKSAVTQRLPCFGNRHILSLRFHSRQQLSKSQQTKKCNSIFSNRSYTAKFKQTIRTTSIKTRQQKQPKTIHRNYLRKQSSQEIKNRKSLEKQRQSSLSGVTYPILLDTQEDLLLTQQQAHKIGSIYDLLSRRKRMKAQ